MGGGNHRQDPIGLLEGEINFTSITSECPEATCAQIVRNGEIVAEGSVTDGEARLLYSDTTKFSQSNWYRLDVYDSNGAKLAITNPIFVGRRKHPQIQTYGEVLKLAFPEIETSSSQ